jgi:hypothetical protein
MKKITLILIVAAFITLLLSCKGADTIFKTLEKSKLAPPLGLASITQSGQITLFWYTSNYEKDFGGYFVFQAEGDLTSMSSDSALSSAFVKMDSVVINEKDADTKNYSDKIVTSVRNGLINGKTYSLQSPLLIKKTRKRSAIRATSSRTHLVRKSQRSRLNRPRQTRLPVTTHKPDLILTHSQWWKCRHMVIQMQTVLTLSMKHSIQAAGAPSVHGFQG